MTQQASISAKAREFSLSEAEFKKLTGLVYSLTGIVLGDHKRDMVYGRLARRLRELGMQSFSQYCDLLDSNKSGQETGFLVNAITTNLTKFYRESHHFEALIMHTQRIAQDPVRKQSKELLIWSAGCSSGEEPYSMATTLMSAVPALHSWKVKILSTDLDTNMLNKGKQGARSPARRSSSSRTHPPIPRHGSGRRSSRERARCRYCNSRGCRSGSRRCVPPRASSIAETRCWRRRTRTSCRSRWCSSAPDFGDRTLAEYRQTRRQLVNRPARPSASRR